MAAEIKRDPALAWLDHVQPVGLVVAPLVLKDRGLVPTPQTQADTAVLADLLNDKVETPALREPWALVQNVLGWESQHVLGSPGAPPLPEQLQIRLPQHDTTLSPTWAVRELGGDGKGFQLLVRIEATGVDPDARGALEGWEATPHQRFERLLRESSVLAGLLIAERNDRKDGRDRYLPEVRLIYAPRGETSGHLSFPLRDLAKVAGRPMLGGLKLLLDSFRLWSDATERRLPSLLKQSREAQASVSTALAEQVLGALHELLRGLNAAEPKLIRELARTRSGHLYEGLLTVLMRLVFILYAEDRDLIPSRTDGRSREIYETSYSLRGLYARLVEDAALNPDTMEERRGGWGQLLALFRLIHKGHASHFVQARGGKLFDPDQFPFLEGRATPADPARVPTVSDACVLRILEGLMTLQVKGGARERLSYRTLDVEQIGSVYETVMGFTVETTAGRSIAIKAGKHNRTPVFVDLEKLAVAKGRERIKFLKEQAERGQLSANIAKAVESAGSAVELAAALDPIVDERGSPKKHESAAGTPILQPTDERRRTGSHYTPRSLTEPIVRHALEPAFERLGLDATPEQILDLKVCDPAMGSGAFLVEACRALAARLIEAWSRHPAKKPSIPPDEDEDLHARRLVAQRCLYGVDKNPLATDLAKLSLWLATLARDHEFTFLDHALKSGDSLVGLTQAQVATAHWDTSKPGLPLFRQLVEERVAEVMKGRAEIQAASDDTARAIQEARHRSLEQRIRDVRTIGDAVIAAFFAEEKPRDREKLRAQVESWLTGSLRADLDKVADFALSLKKGAHPLTPFHWQIEFPEVFAWENGGFDAVVGNPPFLGGSKIEPSLGRSYAIWLLHSCPGAHGKSDLVAFFFRRAFSIICPGGTFGLVATNTIAQGETRSTSILAIISEGGTIYRATRRVPWPGEAAVIVSVIHIARGVKPPSVLNDRTVLRISAYLMAGEFDADPNALADNRRRAFLGTKIYGSGFLFDDAGAKKGISSSIAQMEELLARNPSYISIIKPYIGGEEINSDPRQRHNRFVIDFGDAELGAVRARWPDALAVVERLVKPERDTDKRAARKKYWWRFGDPQPGLYRAIENMKKVAVCAQTAPMHSIAIVPTSYIFSDKIVAFALEPAPSLAMLQSRIHETWMNLFKTTMKDDRIYTIERIFETFPFPSEFQISSILAGAAQAYHDHRAALMIERNEGMTRTSNRFHDRGDTAQDIASLRELHAAMDRAVLEAYAWHDLAERAEPIFLEETNEDDHTYQGRLFWPAAFRDEVLARLLALNAERHAEEVHLGIAPGMKKKSRNDDDEPEDE
jgi:hypothetical protein